jgi:hypothetical protein
MSSSNNTSGSSQETTPQNDKVNGLEGAAETAETAGTTESSVSDAATGRQSVILMSSVMNGGEGSGDRDGLDHLYKHENN